MTETKMNEILELHKKWLNGAADGKQAYLRGADLRSAYLRGADLRGADLRGAYLQGANLRGAYLQDANLLGADLRGADLHGAVLQGAVLRGAVLKGAVLQGAVLRGAYLQGANLQDANLQDANLLGAVLRGAALHGAVLHGAFLLGADLQGAVLHGAKNVPLLPCTSIVPECGSFVGWKKVGAYIIKLKILDNAKRSNASGRKCRCSAAEVLEIQNLDGTKADIDRIYNKNYCGADYIVGEIVTPDSFDDDRWNECSHGIHFFITRQEAVEY